MAGPGGNTNLKKVGSHTCVHDNAETYRLVKEATDPKMHIDTHHTGMGK
jgi:hypothetical protein